MSSMCSQGIEDYATVTNCGGNWAKGYGLLRHHPSVFKIDSLNGDSPWFEIVFRLITTVDSAEVFEEYTPIENTHKNSWSLGRGEGVRH